MAIERGEGLRQTIERAAHDPHKLRAQQVGSQGRLYGLVLKVAQYVVIAVGGAAKPAQMVTHRLGVD